jgi:hypothetical protein
MTADEMRIQLDIVLQQADSKRFNTLEPEEADILLTNAQAQFTENRISKKSNTLQKGFQEDVKRYEDLQALISPPVEITTYIDSTDSNKVFAILPNNYHHLIADSSIISRKCLGYSYTTQTVTEEWIAVVEFGDSSDDITSNLIVDIDGVTVFDIGDYSNITSKFVGYAAKYFIIHMIINELALQGIEVRWEYYGSMYHKNSFIFISKNPLDAGKVIELASYTLSVEADYTPVTRTKIVPDSALVTVTRPNRLSKTEQVDNMLIDPISKTSWRSPISMLEERELKAFYDNTFLIHKLRVRYIKKPRMISCVMNYNCQLDERFHREIVLIAAQLAKAYVNAEDYKLLVNENLKME